MHPNSPITICQLERHLPGHLCRRIFVHDLGTADTPTRRPDAPVANGHGTMRGFRRPVELVFDLIIYLCTKPEIKDLPADNLVELDSSPKRHGSNIQSPPSLRRFCESEGTRFS